MHTVRTCFEPRRHFETTISQQLYLAYVILDNEKETERGTHTNE